MDAAQVSAALDGTPFLIAEETAQGMAREIGELQERVATLRTVGRLTPETLRRYYGDKRFEQVAESNAIEGSTLTAGETKLAVTKGVTLTGHDPAHVRDAVALDKALQRLAELAQADGPTDIPQLQQLHELILEGSRGAGMFRDVPVRITGSEHRPPKTWKEVMAAMDQWEKWSLAHRDAGAVVRATVLHAWLAHIHPYRDGNGRAARAVQNLELVRAGYPPVIIRKTQDRDRYIDSLHRVDDGDLCPFLDLILDRTRAALTGLEIAAREKQGFDPRTERLRQAQRRQLDIWNKAVELLHSMIVERLTRLLEPAGGQVRDQLIGGGLELEDYIELCGGRPVSRSWSFRIEIAVPAVGAVERLAWVGYRSEELRRAWASDDAAPALFWSEPNPGKFPPWRRVTRSSAPGFQELTLEPGQGDAWHAFDGVRESKQTTSQLAEAIASGFLALLPS